jgi:uncharacterized membrane protein
MKTIKMIKTAAIVILLIGSGLVNAQNPPHPNSGVTPGSGNTVVGGQQGGAPIGSGTFLLIGLAGLYAGKKTYNLKKQSIL